MTDTKNLPLAVCYPPGAGGNFLGSALNFALFGTEFQIDCDGKCHSNKNMMVPHYVPNYTIQGMQDEIAALQSIVWSASDKFVITGHVHNIVAMLDLCPTMWFIKINFDPSNSKEVEFLYRMLTAKVPAKQGLAQCYDAVRHSAWPLTLKEFLALPNSEELYQQQNYHTFENWFWVENKTTKRRTLELDLQDIFLGVPGERLSCWFDKTTVDCLFDLVRQYQLANQKLYPDIFKLLE